MTLPPGLPGPICPLHQTIKHPSPRYSPPLLPQIFVTFPFPILFLFSAYRELKSKNKSQHAFRSQRKVQPAQTSYIHPLEEQQAPPSSPHLSLESFKEQTPLVCGLNQLLPYS